MRASAASTAPERPLVASRLTWRRVFSVAVVDFIEDARRRPLRGTRGRRCWADSSTTRSGKARGVAPPKKSIREETRHRRQGRRRDSTIAAFLVVGLRRYDYGQAAGWTMSPTDQIITYRPACLAPQSRRCCCSSTTSGPERSKYSGTTPGRTKDSVRLRRRLRLGRSGARHARARRRPQTADRDSLARGPERGGWR